MNRHPIRAIARSSAWPIAALVAAFLWADAASAQGMSTPGTSAASASAPASGSKRGAFKRKLSKLRHSPATMPSGATGGTPEASSRTPGGAPPSLQRGITYPPPADKAAKQ